MPHGVRTSHGSSPEGGWRVRREAEVDSTNRVLLAEARDGEPSGAVLVAAHQTAGRGRLDRSWESRPGDSLLVSVLVRPVGPDDAHHCVLAAAVALVAAVAEVAGVDAGVKWPNDVVVGDRKLAGVLAERHDDALVIGLGCNVAQTAFADDLAATATSLAIEGAGEPPSTGEVLDAFLDHLGRLLARPDDVIPLAREASATLGRAVRVEQSDGFVEGLAFALRDDGALLVLDDHAASHAVVVGDVVHLRTTD